jgi:hypothetical protein
MYRLLLRTIKKRKNKLQHSSNNNFFTHLSLSLYLNKEIESQTYSESNGSVDKVFEMSQETRKDYSEAQKENTDSDRVFGEGKSDLVQTSSDESNNGATTGM